MKDVELEILFDALAGQPLRSEARLSAERIRQVLEGGPPFSFQEEQMLWECRASREAFWRTRDTMIQEARRYWQDEGHGEVVWLRAAAGQGPVTIKGNGYSVSCFRTQSDAPRWVVSLKIEREIAGKLPRRTKVRLVDTGGREWLKGAIDDTCQIGVIWNDPGISPVDRAHEHGIRLDIEGMGTFEPSQEK